jgi:hypothetical protein
MSATIRDLPTPLTQLVRQREEDARELEELREWKRQADRPTLEMVQELVDAQRQLAILDDFIEHVQTRKAARWDKVPMKRTRFGEVGFERLVEMRKG